LAGKSGPHCNYNEQREKVTWYIFTSLIFT
jgi:hypothetical protein